MSRLQLKDSNHKESYEGTQLGQIKYIVNCTEQTTEGIQATYMELLVRRAMKRVPGPISCFRLPGTLQQPPHDEQQTSFLPAIYPMLPITLFTVPYRPTSL